MNYEIIFSGERVEVEKLLNENDFCAEGAGKSPASVYSSVSH